MLQASPAGIASMMTTRKKRASAGAWDIVSSDALLAQPLDLELRVFARSASDDKAPIMMFLAAFDGLAEIVASPAINACGSPVARPLHRFDLRSQLVERSRLRGDVADRLAEGVVLLRRPDSALGHRFAAGGHRLVLVDLQLANSKHPVLLERHHERVRRAERERQLAASDPFECQALAERRFRGHPVIVSPGAVQGSWVTACAAAPP
jgi:hypothetical protein